MALFAVLVTAAILLIAVDGAALIVTGATLGATSVALVEVVLRADRLGRQDEDGNGFGGRGPDLDPDPPPHEGPCCSPEFEAAFRAFAALQPTRAGTRD